MNNRKKTIASYFFLIGVIFSLRCQYLFPVEASKPKNLQQDIQLTVPVRADRDGAAVSGLRQDELIFKVNGKARQIQSLIEKTRYLSERPALGRNFILSFHMTEYGSLVEKAVSYFISEILHPADSLIIVTPLKIYRITVSGNKEKIEEDIADLMQADCLQYKKNRANSEKNLRIQIKTLRNVLQEGARSFDLGARQVMAARQFLDTFPREFIKFRELSLLLDTSKYAKLVELLGYRSGERWWIHFHHQEESTLLTYIAAFMKELENYVYTRENILVNNFIHLQKVLSISSSFPVEEVTETLVGVGISYHPVAFGGLTSPSREAGETEKSGLTRLLNRISRASGGLPVYAAHPIEAVKKIVAHRDTYYELNYLFDGNIENKALELFWKKESGDKKARLCCKRHFEKKELQELIHHLTQERVKITGFKIKRNLIAFTVNSFQRQEEKKFGILAVRIELIERAGREQVTAVPVFHTQKTLRCSPNQAEVMIRLPLPVHFHGNYFLRITVGDIIANHLVSVRHPISL